jgi:DNA repair ATPase RecN
MTPLDLDGLRKLVAPTQPVIEEYGDGEVWLYRGQTYIEGDEAWDEYHEDLQEYAAAARTALPALLERVEAQAARIEADAERIKELEKIGRHLRYADKKLRTNMMIVVNYLSGNVPSVAGREVDAALGILKAALRDDSKVYLAKPESK